MAPSNPAQALGSNIRAEMARRGVNQTTLSAVLGISQGQLSKRLRGVIVMDVNELQAIATFLGVSVSVLLHETALESVA